MLGKMCGHWELSGTIEREDNMKYKVGDKVKIREDLEVGKMYGEIKWSGNCTKHGEVCKITNVYSNNYGVEGCYLITDEMIEGLAPTFKERSTRYFKSKGGDGGESIFKNCCCHVDCGDCMFDENEDDCLLDTNFDKAEQLLTEWEKEQDMFKKDDLRTGDVVTCKNGDKYMVMLNTNHGDILSKKHNGFNNLSAYNDLLHIIDSTEYNIINISRSSSSGGIGWVRYENGNYKTIWEATTPAKQKALDRLEKAKEELTAATKLVEDM
jgi:hypothetical protein